MMTYYQLSQSVYEFQIYSELNLKAISRKSHTKAALKLKFCDLKFSLCSHSKILKLLNVLWAEEHVLKLVPLRRHIHYRTLIFSGFLQCHATRRKVFLQHFCCTVYEVLSKIGLLV